MLFGGAFAWWRNEQAQLLRQREGRNAEAVAALLGQCEEALRTGDAAKAKVALDAARKRSAEGGADEHLTSTQAFNQIAVQAVLEGIGVYFSSGDNGDEAARVGRPETDFSADDPWVTAVGGTSLGINQNNKVIVQTGWEIGRGLLVNGAWATPKWPGPSSKRWSKAPAWRRTNSGAERSFKRAG